MEISKDGRTFTDLQEDLSAATKALEAKVEVEKNIIEAETAVENAERAPSTSRTVVSSFQSPSYTLCNVILPVVPTPITLIKSLVYDADIA